MDPQTEPAQRWVLNANLVTRSVGGQVFILMPDSTMHILENESAVLLYSLLRGSPEVGQSAEDLVSALLENFEVSGEMAREDVRDFVRDLHGLGILSIRP